MVLPSLQLKDHIVYCFSLQDHKQFHGELFGIGNLFRDLSDKLFTSDIVELHEKREYECTDQKGLNNLGEHFIQPSESSLSESRVKKTGISDSTATRKPLLEELGKSSFTFSLKFFLKFNFHIYSQTPTYSY